MAIRKFAIGDEVILKINAFQQQEKHVGKVVGYYNTDFPIILLANPTTNSDLAAIYNSEQLKLKE